MILDSYLKLSAEQAVTATAASTSYIDTKGVSDAIGSLIALLKVDTTADSSGDAATLTLDIQTSDTTTFSGATSIANSGALAEAILASGFTKPMTIAKTGLKRYIRGYYTVGTENFTAGAFTLALVKDADLGTIG